MIDTIILDLDGPLLDGIDRHYACYSEILGELGFEPIARDPYWRQKRARVARKELLAQSYAAQRYDEFARRWLELIESKQMLALDRLQPEVLSVLTRWSRSGKSMVLATMRNHRQGTLRQLDETGLLPCFDHVCVTGSQDRGGKAAAVREFAYAAGCNLENAIWVGDTEVDIEAARQLGIPIYAVTNGLRSEEVLLRYSPDFAVQDLQAVHRMVDGAEESNERAA